MFVASSSEPLPCFLNHALGGQKWTHPGDHMFYIDLYKEKLRVLQPVNFVNITNGTCSM